MLRIRPIVIAAASLLVTCSVLAQTTPEAPAKPNDTTPSKEALTPTDQGSSKADRDMTAQIRKEVVANKSLSVSAHNVKIITNAGKVTLRGAVNSADEKRQVGDIAAKYAQPENVDNQLEVKAAGNGSGR